MTLHNAIIDQESIGTPERKTVDLNPKIIIMAYRKACKQAEKPIGTRDDDIVFRMCLLTGWTKDTVETLLDIVLGYGGDS